MHDANFYVITKYHPVVDKLFYSKFIFSQNMKNTSNVYKLR